MYADEVLIMVSKDPVEKGSRYERNHLPFSPKARVTLTDSTIQTVKTCSTVFTGLIFAVWTKLTSKSGRKKKNIQNSLMSSLQIKDTKQKALTSEERSDLSSAESRALRIQPHNSLRKTNLPLARVQPPTLTNEASVVHHARATVEAGVGGARVNAHLAVHPHVQGAALAVITYAAGKEQKRQSLGDQERFHVLLPLC